MTTQQRTIPMNEQSDTRRLAAEADRTHVDQDREISNSDIESETTPIPTGDRALPRERLETPYLAEQTSSQAGARWPEIQAAFVDDPRKAVGDAHQLVDDLMRRIVERFAQERDTLERQWSKGEDVSTEELRVCLQNYRAFFDRLLPTAMPAQPTRRSP